MGFASFRMIVEFLVMAAPRQVVEIPPTSFFLSNHPPAWRNSRYLLLIRIDTHSIRYLAGNNEGIYDTIER
jgi:hypothetical protein